MPANRRSFRATAKPLALFASIGLISAGLVLPAQADDEVAEPIDPAEGSSVSSAEDDDGAPAGDGGVADADDAPGGSADVAEEGATEGEGGSGDEGSGEDGEASEAEAGSDQGEGAGEASNAADIAPMLAEVDGVYLSEVYFRPGNDDDFIEIGADGGTDVGGWTVGSLTRGGSVQGDIDAIVTLPDDAVVPDNGVLAVDVDITNSVNNGFGATVFVLTDDDEIAAFYTIGHCTSGGVCDVDSGGVTATGGDSVPEPIRGLTATPTGEVPPSGQSLQWVDEAWTSGEPSPGEPNEADNGGGEDPGEPQELEIAEVWDEPNGTAVTTTGVVTAHYPTGGFNGYTIQTAGSGGEQDEREVSDALFVYSPGTVDDVELGDYVQVTGERGVHFDLHQISVNSGTDWHGVQVLDEEFDEVTPIPDFVMPADEADRLAYQNMLVHPADEYIVSDTYQLGGWGGAYGSIGLALDGPLVQETELINPNQDPDGYAALVAENEARAVTLDDGQSQETSEDADVPYLTGEPNVRTGVGLVFEQPVVVDYRFQWNFQPTEPVIGNADHLVSFDAGDTREANAAPADVGGDVTVAIFNVLNYFTTLGVDQTECTYYSDRDGDPISVNNCSVPDPGPRGAWDETNLERQQGKIVAAINDLDANVVALSEIENSAHFNDDGSRDDSLEILVDALNADAGSDVWAFAPSPEEAPELEHDDVIRNAFIYQPDAVELAGEGVILTGQSEDGQAFDNAREPLAQGFSVAGSDYEFLAVANHFKSKGCGGYPGDEDAPQACFNGDRVEQANALMDFADEVAGEAGIEDIFLMGDFNSYSAEDPVRAFESAGYVNANPAWSPGEEFTGDNTYVFDGRVGSLDHIFMSEAAAERHTGTEVWSINANESVLAEYSRYNYFASEHFTPGAPFRSSDHDPVVIGIDVPEDDDPGLVDLRVLSFNDFHGRIGSGADVVGEDAVAAGMACYVDEQRQQYGEENTLLVSAGDNIGGTTFTSFIADDEPTLDVLLELDLDVSVLGNHEFDQGQDDVNDRVIPYTEGEDGFPWIAANIVDEATGDPVYEPYEIVEAGGINVAFVGAITQDMPNLVSPAGIEGLAFTSISESVNRYAEELTVGEDPEADVVIVVVHEGLSTESDPASGRGTLGELIADPHESIASIITGHTHMEYTHEVDGIWVTQAGEYGEGMVGMDLTIDTETGEVIESAAELVEIEPAGGEACDVAASMMQIVDDARAEADELGSVVIGEATHDFNRAQDSAGEENRAGESVLGALVADAHLWAAQQLDPGAQIAFMNSGGLRDDLAAGEITYREAANIQPFANTLYSMELTGAQLAQVLEEQWPIRDRDGFLKLGHSEGFRYIYDPEAGPGERIIEMLLDGEPIQEDEYYTVVANEFIATGGDGYVTFTEGRNSGTTGQIDLESTVSYVQEHSPLTPDFSQRAVGATWISDPEALYVPGDEVAVDVSSFVFTAGEPVPEVLHTSLGGIPTGEFDLDADPVDGTDEAGRAEIRITVPHALLADQLLSGGLGTMQAGGGAAEGDPAVYAFEIVDETNGTVLTLPVVVAGAAEADPEDPGAGPGGTIPDTGADVRWIVAGMVALLALGGLLLYLHRRSGGASGDGSAAAMADGGSDGGGGGGGD